MKRLARPKKARDTGFHDYVLNDLLGGKPGITSRAMFGGWGLYHDGVIFAIIVGGELYVKADGKGKQAFKAAGSRPFTYTNRVRRKPVEMPYWLVSEDVMEDADTFEGWVAHAVRAAKANR